MYFGLTTNLSAICHTRPPNSWRCWPGRWRAPYSRRPSRSQARCGSGRSSAEFYQDPCNELKSLLQDSGYNINSNSAILTQYKYCLNKEMDNRLFFISSKPFSIVLPSFSGYTTFRNTRKQNKKSIQWLRHPGIHLLSFSTKTQKVKFIAGGKVWNKSCREWFKLMFFLFSWNLKNKEGRTKHAFLLTFSAKLVNICSVHFSDFIKKKNCNSNLNYFQQLLFRTFPHPMNFIFWVLVLILLILKADFRGDVVIGF